jgi:hypothetical protein
LRPEAASAWLPRREQAEKTMIGMAGRWVGAGALALLAWIGAAAAQEADVLLSYEAIPSVQVPLNLDAATYAQREAVTQAALETIAPRVFAAAGVDPAGVETDLTPGGYLLKTNASLQARAPVDQATATRLAAALGYVFRQWSVLVTTFDAAEGGTAYVSVGFPEGALTAEVAQAFFEAAAAVDQGLGGGYTAFGDDMLFLNVRDGEGRPYSGLEDIAFAARLGQAAGAFTQPPAQVVDAGRAEARFVENDWDAASDGENYAATLADPALVEKLDGLRAEHTALVERMAAEFGWR